MRALLLALACLVPLPLPGHADEPPPIEALVTRMKQALEPPVASLRRLTLSVSGEDGTTTQWTLVQARKVVAGQGRILMVVLSPPASRGITSLIVDGTPPQTELYVPAVRRVRTIVPLDGYEAVLNSDFTYFDLGFVRRQDSYTFAGAEDRRGRPAWKLQQVPTTVLVYSRIVTWLDRATGLPIERNYFGPGGQLWKVETFEKVVTVDGQALALQVTMEDRQTGGRSVLEVSNVRMGVELPDRLFERSGLRDAASSPLWAQLDQSR